MSPKLPSRRRFLLAASAGVAGFALEGIPAAGAAPAVRHSAPRKAPKTLPRLPVQQVKTDLLNIGYHTAGPEEGRTVVLLHDFGYDIHSYAEVAKLLAAEGFHVLVPYLRGHGTTRFKDAATPRSGQQAALGSDAIALMDALHIPEAVFAGFGWGARAACVAALLKPTRCVGVVSVNGYPIDDIAKAGSPLSAQTETSLSHQYYYFQTERGRAQLEANRRDIARILWKDNSPAWRFDDAVFERAAEAFDNPDFVDVVIHSYRHRLGRVAGDPQYDEAEKKIAAQPVIAVPSITLEGTASGVAPARDTADKFSGPYSHHPISGAGHNLPQEAPKAFADAVTELVRKGKWRT